MAIQFLLVSFPEERGVLADDAAVGVTNHILMLPADEYRIRLDGTGYSPADQVIALDGTSVVRPLVITFAADTAAAPAAVRGAAPPGAARAAPTPAGSGHPAAAAPGAKARRARKASARSSAVASPPAAAKGKAKPKSKSLPKSTSEGKRDA